MSRNLKLENPNPGLESFPSHLLSPKELAARWRCGRSSVDRIARSAGITRLYLGHGKNGMVRYFLKEVEAYEVKRMIK